MTASNHSDNSGLLKNFYDAYARCDVEAMLAVCSSDVTFQVPGKSRLAGKFTRETVGARYFQPIRELSGDTFKSDIHDVMSSDRHGLVLLTNTLTRGGSKVEYRCVHVWRIQDGKLVAWYEYPRDLYQFDAIWS